MTICSLIPGCIELKVDPYAYLSDIQQRAANRAAAAGLTTVEWPAARG